MGTTTVECHETAGKTGIGGTVDAHKVTDYKSNCPAVAKASKLEPWEDIMPTKKPRSEV